MSAGKGSQPRAVRGETFRANYEEIYGRKQFAAVTEGVAGKSRRERPEPPQLLTPAISPQLSNRPTPETDALWQQLCCSGQSWYRIAECVCDRARHFERERDEAREAFDEEVKFHNRTHGELVQVQRAGLEALRQLIRERDEAREAICELLAMVPRPSCDMFHHSKKDRHGYDEPCPLVERYNAKIKKAEEAAK